MNSILINITYILYTILLFGYFSSFYLMGSFYIDTVVYKIKEAEKC